MAELPARQLAIMVNAESNGVPSQAKISKRPVKTVPGMATINRDSGTFEGRREIGRRGPDAGTALHGDADGDPRQPGTHGLLPSAPHQRKPTKLALVAAMRKLPTILNIMLARGRAWGANVPAPEPTAPDPTKAPTASTMPSHKRGLRLGRARRGSRTEASTPPPFDKPLARTAR